MSFTHLHVHTDYSLFDGIAKIPELFERANQLKMPGLAITDHGTMAGVPEFLRTSRNYQDVKPIIGCECYLTDHFDCTIKKKGTFHILLLAKNKTGYYNLVRLCSIANTDGLYSRPRISHKLLEQYHEGLICTSACIGGEIPQQLLDNDFDKAREAASWYRRVFGEDFYLEVWNHEADSDVSLSGFDNQDAFKSANRELATAQKKARQGLFALSKELGIKVIASNDVHFVNREDAIAQDTRLCISTGKKVNDADRLRYSHMEFLRSESEMRRMFSSHPEAIDNTQEILDKVERYSIYADPVIPSISDDPKSELRKKVYDGAISRYGKLDDEVNSRIVRELDVIGKNNCENYFLLWKELVDWTRGEGRTVGSGRGSAAGSIVNYCLGITGVDPLRHKLLFERFLNPDSTSFPDTGMLFECTSRDKARIVEHLKTKYGAEAVSYVSAQGLYPYTTAFKECAEVYGADVQIVNHILSLIRHKNGYYSYGSHTLLHYRCNDDYITRKCSDNAKIREAYDTAAMLEGTYRDNGVHVCGILVGIGPLAEQIPMTIDKVRFRNSTKAVLASQYSKDDVEDFGILKLDIFDRGILDVIEETTLQVREKKGISIDSDDIPLDDEQTYALFAAGKTSDIHHFHSEGMREKLRALKPDRFSDLVAMEAMYRPGIKDLIPELISRKHGQTPVDFMIPELKDILGETYGIIVYHEQTMEIVERIGGFTHGEADRLRKAVGKHQVAVLNELGARFMSGGMQAGFPDNTLENIWAAITSTGHLAFNKSFAICDTWLAYRSAWLKAHYPEEYTWSYREIFPEE